jgi:hypothetical protein
VASGIQERKEGLWLEWQEPVVREDLLYFDFLRATDICATLEAEMLMIPCNAEVLRRALAPPPCSTAVLWSLRGS